MSREDDRDPRETLRRHYQRYLKAMGINKTPEPNRSATSTPTKSSMETLAAAASAVTSAAASDSADAASRYSSLLDIGQAYGIWNPSEDNSNDLESDQKDLKIVEDDDDEAGASSDDKESDELKVDLSEKVIIETIILYTFFPQNECILVMRCS